MVLSIIVACTSPRVMRHCQVSPSFFKRKFLRKVIWKQLTWNPLRVVLGCTSSNVQTVAFQDYKRTINTSFLNLIELEPFHGFCLDRCNKTDQCHCNEIIGRRGNISGYGHEPGADHGGGAADQRKGQVISQGNAAEPHAGGEISARVAGIELWILQKIRAKISCATKAD